MTTPEVQPKEKSRTADEHRDQERQAALRASIQKGRIAFLLRPTVDLESRSRIIYIFDPEDPKKHYYFCAVCTGPEIDVQEESTKPFDMLVDKSKGRNINDPGDVAISLAEFLGEFFPEAKETNFKIYGSHRKYRKDKALVHRVYPSEYIKNVIELKQPIWAGFSKPTNLLLPLKRLFIKKPTT